MSCTLTSNGAFFAAKMRQLPDCERLLFFPESVSLIHEPIVNEEIGASTKRLQLPATCIERCHRMIWDLIQQVQIAHTQSKIEAATFAAGDASRNTRLLQDRVKRLEESVERLSLATMAIAEILRDRMGVTQQELESRVLEIDLRDGKQDGRLSAPTNECPECHHANAAHRKACLYCGQDLGVKSGLFVAQPLRGNMTEDETPR